LGKRVRMEEASAQWRVEGETCYKLALQERPIISTYC
jgi:hypothetical protein